MIRNTELLTVWTNPLLKRAVQLSIVLLIVLSSETVFIYYNVPPQIPLWYSRPWGIEQLAPKSFLLFLAFCGITIALLHSVTASYFLKTDRLSAYLILWTGIVLLFLLLLSIATVYLRVGSML